MGEGVGEAVGAAVGAGVGTGPSVVAVQAHLNQCRQLTVVCPSTYFGTWFIHSLMEAAPMGTSGVKCRSEIHASPASESKVEVSVILETVSTPLGLLLWATGAKRDRSTTDYLINAYSPHVCAMATPLVCSWVGPPVYPSSENINSTRFVG